mgnify:CR=1 FL=1
MEKKIITWAKKRPNHLKDVQCNFSRSEIEKYEILFKFFGSLDNLESKSIAVGDQGSDKFMKNYIYIAS